MQCIVTFATAMCPWLSKSCTEIWIFNMDTCHPDTIYWREQRSEALSPKHKWQCGACSLHAGWLRLQTRTQNIQYFSNKSPTRCNNFPVYYPDVYLQLNIFRAFSRPSSGVQWLQWQPLVLPSYRHIDIYIYVYIYLYIYNRPDHEHSTAVTSICR